MILRLDAREKTRRRVREQRKRFGNPRQRTRQSFADDVLLGDAQLAVRPPTAELDQDGVYVVRDPTPGAQSATRSNQRDLVAHLGAQGVEPSVHLGGHGRFMGLHPEEAIQRVTRETSVPAGRSHAVQHPSVGPSASRWSSLLR
ncbi:MAG: hypothetical protein WBB42_09790 [Polyangiales bacterium]